MSSSELDVPGGDAAAGKRKSSGATVHNSPPVVAAPPRDVPTSMKIEAYLGGFCQLGCVILGVGMFVYWFWFPKADVERWIYFRGQLDQARGQVTAVEQTGWGEGNADDRRSVHAIHYEFMHQGETYRHVSYETETKRTVGIDVPIEFPPGDPAHSRIVGLRSNVYSPWVGLVGIIPLVGLGFVFYGARKARRHLHLLRHGLVAPATLVDQEKSTSPYSDEEQVWKLHFEYKVDGVAYRTTHKTIRVKPFRAAQTVLYLPENPARAVLVGQPGLAVLLGQIEMGPRFDAQGQLQPHTTGSTARLMFIPALTVLVHGGIYIYQLWKL